MKKITAILTLIAMISSFCISVYASDMEYAEATKDAVVVTADMIVSADENVSGKYIAENLFTYEEASNEEIANRGGITAEYMIYFGDEADVLGIYRSYIAGEQGTAKGKIELFGGSEPDGDFVSIGVANTTVAGEWNEIKLKTDAVYRYVKVITTVNDYEIIVEATEVPETDEDDESIITSITGSDVQETTTVKDKNAAASVKTVFIPGARSIETDDVVAGGYIGGIGAAGGISTGVSKFPDCRGHWAEQIINACADREYLNGYEDGTFRPDNPVTAAEFAKIYGSWTGDIYQITTGYWALPYIRNLMDSGMFENGEFSDYGTYMTREQVARAIVRSLKGEYFPKDLSKYASGISDYNEAGAEYSDFVIKAYMSGIMSGFEDGSFRPKEGVTRAEILTIISRALNPQIRKIPDSVGADALNAPETYTYYTAAAHVRKNPNANSQSYKIYNTNARYMEENDDASGLKIIDEMQGANGMAFLLRYDLSDILKREDKLKSISLIVTWARNGDMELGLFPYEYRISDFNWSTGVTKVINNNSVAGDDKTGYNSVIDNITVQLPTWNDQKNAVPQEQKTQPFARAELKDNKYVFELSLDTLKKYMREDNTVEFFITTVNYDKYGLDKDNKPNVYTAGENAPQLYCEFEQ